MKKKKYEFLEKEDLLNQKPERVSPSLFADNDFFDPLDLTQVRYEMLRSARIGKTPVVKACKLFGFSREYFYRLERNFMVHGLVSLLGSPKGRRPLIAINQEIVNFIVHRRIDNPKLSGDDLRKEILKLYKIDCSRRTVERVIERAGLGKKGPC
ncbi:hypothetical protein N9934_03030 [Desulfosarcina sp.]|nr:hypothetical protein [Desulfosarcina sp.]